MKTSYLVITKTPKGESSEQLERIPLSYAVSIRYHPYQRPHTNAESSHQGRRERSYQNHQSQTHATSSRHTSDSRSIDTQQNQHNHGFGRDRSPMTNDRNSRQYNSEYYTGTNSYGGQNYGRYDSQHSRGYSARNGETLNSYRNKEDESHSRVDTYGEESQAGSQYFSDRHEHGVAASHQSLDYHARDYYQDHYASGDWSSHMANQEQSWSE